MKLETPKKSLTLRIVAMLSGIAVAGFLALVTSVDFVTVALADPGAGVTESTVVRAALTFGWSARLQRRAAALALQADEPDLERARFFARRAVDLAPNDSTAHVLLASAEEAAGDTAAAEHDLRAACDLAPGQPDPRWRLGNLCVRQGRIDEGLGAIAKAVAQDPSLLAPAFDVAWSASNGDRSAIGRVASGRSEDRVEAARFLVARGDTDSAVAEWNALDSAAKYAFAPGRFLTELYAAGRPGLARSLFAAAMAPDRDGSAFVWDPGFDEKRFGFYTPFEWTVQSSDHARVAVEPGAGLAGSSAARIDFAGRDTTNLVHALEQPISLLPKTHVHVECKVRTRDLDSPEGPRLVLRTSSGQAWRATSAAIVDTAGAWTTVSLDAITPDAGVDGVCALVIAIERVPTAAYDTPTRGTIWIDDVVVTEVKP